MSEWDNFRWLVNVFTYLHGNQDKTGVKLSQQTLELWDEVVSDTYRPFLAAACKRFGITPDLLQVRWIVLMAGLLDNPSAKVRVENACAFFAGIFGKNVPPNVGFLTAPAAPFSAETATSRLHSDAPTEGTVTGTNPELPAVVSIFDGTALTLPTESAPDALESFGALSLAHGAVVARPSHETQTARRGRKRKGKR